MSHSLIPILPFMLDKIKAQADSVFSDVVRLRRQIHQHPELAFEEHETAALVKNTLEPLGLDLHTGIAQTGLIATLKGNKAGPTVMLRADMDALPIHEETGLDFASNQDGAMHACGHDAHTASLLGTAMILSELKSELQGTVRFLFQPSEERLPGGARVMIEEGALQGNGAPAPDAIFGQHVQPDLPAGKIGVRSGMYMASSDELFVTVKGEGGHAASPHQLQTDATLVAAHIMTALQTIISRNCPPDVPSVLTIGRLTADGATNVIPESAYMEGTFRSMDEDWRFRAHDLIKRVVRHTAQALGAEADVDLRVGYPALYNHSTPTEQVHQAALDYVGEENTIDLDPWFASEDFAYYLREMPGSFYRIGTGNEEEGITHGLHTPRFNIDEEALRTAPGFMAYLAWQYGASA